MRLISFSQDGLIARITLNRPKKLNAFNSELVEELIQTLRRATSSEAKLLVFQAVGKGFSGGFDLSNIEQSSDGDLVLRFIRVEQLLQAVHHAPLATLALVHGPCYGAAAELVASCQWRVATPDAKFRMPGLKFGLVLGTRRLAALIGENAFRRLILNDSPFNSAEGLSAGYLTQIADKQEWADIETAVLAKASALAPATFTRLSSQLRQDFRDSDLAELVRSTTDWSVKERILSYLNGTVVNQSK